MIKTKQEYQDALERILELGKLLVSEEENNKEALSREQWGLVEQVNDYEDANEDY